MKKVVVILLVVGVCLIGFGGYLHFSGNGDDKASENEKKDDNKDEEKGDSEAAIDILKNTFNDEDATFQIIKEENGMTMVAVTTSDGSTTNYCVWVDTGMYLIEGGSMTSNDVTTSCGESTNDADGPAGGEALLP